MKKPYEFTELSDRKCVKCGRPIKANVAARKAELKPLYCNPCHHDKEAGRGHRMGKHGKPRSKRVMAGLPIKGVRG